MRPSITLTTPVDAEPQYPGETFDKHIIEHYKVEPEYQRITVWSSDAFVRDGRVYHGESNRRESPIHNDTQVALVFDAVGSNAMETAILEWLLEQNHVDGSIT